MTALLLVAVAWAQNTAHYLPNTVWSAEDVTGGTSDADQNDVAIRVNGRCIVDTGGFLRTEVIDGVGLTAGASLTNALWWASPNTAGVPASVTLRLGGGPAVSLCSGDCAPTFEVVADPRTLFVTPPGGFVNTGGGAIVTGVPFELEITHPPGTNAYVGPCDAAFSLRRGASVIDDAAVLGNGQPLVGRFDDWCSVPGAGCPLDRIWSVPTEQTPVDGAYGSDFLCWLAERTGDTPCGPVGDYDDWYEAPVGPIVDRTADYATTAPLADQPTCTDGIHNQDETGTDCGGLVCAACMVARVSTSSSGAQGNGDAEDPRLSSDGRFVVFSSLATNHVSGDTNASKDVFRKDRLTGATIRVSVATGGAQGDRTSQVAEVSGDGNRIVFQSRSLNFGSSDPSDDVYVRDVAAGTTTLVSVRPGGVEASQGSVNADISADGRYVVYQTLDSGIVTPDANGGIDVLVWDSVTGTTARASESVTGTIGNGSSRFAAISGDGRYVTFQSSASNLVPGDTNAQPDVFVKDMTTGVVERISVSSGGVGRSGRRRRTWWPAT